MEVLPVQAQWARPSRLSSRPSILWMPAEEACPPADDRPDSAPHAPDLVVPVLGRLRRRDGWMRTGPVPPSLRCAVPATSWPARSSPRCPSDAVAWREPRTPTESSPAAGSDSMPTERWNGPSRGPVPKIEWRGWTTSSCSRPAGPELQRRGHRPCPPPTGFVVAERGGRRPGPLTVVPCDRGAGKAHPVGPTGTASASAKLPQVPPCFALRAPGKVRADFQTEKTYG